MKLLHRDRETALRGHLMRAVVSVFLGICMLPVTDEVWAAESSPLVLVSSTTTGTFGLEFDSPQFCPGDSEAGYLWQTFLVQRPASPQRLTFRLGIPDGLRRGFSLRDPSGSWIRNRNPGLVDGQVIPPMHIAINQPAYRDLKAGEYWLGIACTRERSNGVTRTERVWALAVDVTASSNGQWSVTPKHQPLHAEAAGELGSAPDVASVSAVDAVVSPTVEADNTSATTASAVVATSPGRLDRTEVPALRDFVAPELVSPAAGSTTVEGSPSVPTWVAVAAIVCVALTLTVRVVRSARRTRRTT